MGSSQATGKERDKIDDGRYARPSVSSGRWGTSRRGDGWVPPATSSSRAADKADGGPYVRSSDSSWGRFRKSPDDADSVRVPPLISYTEAADKADPYAHPSDFSSGRIHTIPLDYGVKRTGSLLQPTSPQQELDVAGAYGGDALLLGKVQDRPVDAHAVGDPRPVEGAEVLDAGVLKDMGDADGVLDMDMGDADGVLDMDMGDDDGDVLIFRRLGVASASREPTIRMLSGNLDDEYQMNMLLDASNACAEVNPALDQALNQGKLHAQRKCDLDLVSTSAGIDLNQEDVQNCPVGRRAKVGPRRKKIHRHGLGKQFNSMLCEIDKMNNLEVENVQNYPVDRGPRLDPQSCKADPQHRPVKTQVSSKYRKISKVDHLDPEDVQNCHCPEPAITQVSPIYSKANKMKDPQHVYLNYTWGIHNNDLTCMIMAVLLFNIILPFLPLPDFSMDDSISVVWRISLMICAHIFLLILPIRTATGIMDALCRTFFGPLLGFVASKLVSPLTGMALAYLSTAWVSGMFGYSLSQYLQHVGMEQAANVAVTLHLSLSKKKRRQRVYTQIDSVFHSSIMITLLAALIMWLVSSTTEEIYFVVWILSVLVWWIVCFSSLILSSFMLDGPCVTERIMAYYIASFPASIPLALISQLLWTYFFGIEMMVMSAFFGYKLAIYARYKSLVAKGGEDTANLEDDSGHAETNASSNSSSSTSDSSESGDEESIASSAAAPAPAHEEINTSSYSSASSESGEESTASYAAAPAPAHEEINTSSYSSCSSESGDEETTASYAAAPAPASEEITAAIRDCWHEKSMFNGDSAEIMSRELEKLSSDENGATDDVVKGAVAATVGERSPELRDLKKLVQNAASVDDIVNSADPPVTKSDTVEETLPLLAASRKTKRKHVVVAKGFSKGRKILGC